ncbi:helix-turn-helix domain-containing protein [Streptococcus suis]|uniref:helix-turn-helix domain-containing protein n=1 Tax=Streptococcus suis TaxID=1307 RepID=UPI00094336D1|nr:helix-turn-helix transcriptional regulator [Streptococcus suis]MCB2883659.1 helix-turn-helix transcriptional regulator [Streptococcus suis]MCB2910422.1 helix-turn-helix transcriptional regulator [Streptococcus suis]MCB2912497.1 helix-turn-helix transcriptional regulator [Streptococcus suis]MDS1159978.1 helix-turn-helix transcriptional regulator [Streptococcus suis]WNF60382.1 helix-turn-helix transcriptional regulator [Streptococcus suis]
MNRLKELRTNKGVSLSKMSRELKEKYGISVSLSQLNYYEKGIRSPRDSVIWEKIADYFGVEVGYLLGYTDEPTNRLRDLLFHEIKALKEYRVLRCGFENFISENDVLNVIDKYTKLTCREPR